MKIIAFAGMPFSGKSEAVSIAREMKIPIIRMGDFIWEETKNQGLEINDYNVGMIAEEMRKKYGMDIWAEKTLEKIKNMKKSKILIIDGIRNIEEIEKFEKIFGNNFILIAIQVSDKIRYKRAMSRGREDDSKDLKLIKERDKRELSWGLDKVIASADIVITNQGLIDEFKRRIKEILIKFDF